MPGARITLALALAIGALVLAGCGGDDEASVTTDTQTTTETTTPAGTTLQASVGPGFDISLTQDGQDVATLAAGEYTIEVDDQSDIHNFHLTGPGVDEDSGVSETGTSTWTVTFEAGSYHYQCDPHASQMNGDFEVTG
jgi:plastocyanin